MKKIVTPKSKNMKTKIKKGTIKAKRIKKISFYLKSFSDIPSLIGNCEKLDFIEAPQFWVFNLASNPLEETIYCVAKRTPWSWMLPKIDDQYDNIMDMVRNMERGPDDGGEKWPDDVADKEDYRDVYTQIPPHIYSSAGFASRFNKLFDEFFAFSFNEVLNSNLDISSSDSFSGKAFVYAFDSASACAFNTAFTITFKSEFLRDFNSYLDKDFATAFARERARTSGFGSLFLRVSASALEKNVYDFDFVDGLIPEQRAVYFANYTSQKINQHMFEY